jgi:hypothetical protein
MTTRLGPGSPKLQDENGKVAGDDVLSDSEWDDLQEPDKTQENLSRIAKARKGNK